MSPSRDDWLGLSQKVCVVTGGGSGIGASVAQVLAAQGAWVAVLDRDSAAASKVANSINSTGGRALGLAADIIQEADIAIAASKVKERLGPCDVLVNNAALLLGSTGRLLDTDLSLWNQMLAVNLTGALICVRAFAKQMMHRSESPDRKCGGSIVNVASICGHLPRPEGGAYSPSKAALIMMTRMLALELAEHRIRCNSVSPAWVRTPASEATYRDPVIHEQRRAMVPAGRISEGEDLGEVIAFLASDRSSYMNGQDVLVDGGLSQTLMRLVPKSVKPTPI